MVCPTLQEKNNQKGYLGGLIDCSGTTRYRQQDGNNSGGKKLGRGTEVGGKEMNRGGRECATRLEKCKARGNKEGGKERRIQTTTLPRLGCGNGKTVKHILG